MMIDLITTGIRTRMQTVLGSDYGSLPYIINVEKNNYRNNQNRFGCRALTATETDSVTKYVTNSQIFELVITKAYYDSSLDDASALSTAHLVQDSILDIYKDLVNTKAGTPGSVLNINNLIINEPEYIEDSKVVVIRANIEVLYRFSLT